MINAAFREYDYYKTTVNKSYGQEVLPPLSATPEGKVKLSIFSTSKGTQDNILYMNCQYIGFTYDTEIDDKYIIQYGKERLKVLYIQSKGRYKQVFLKRVN